MIQIQDCCELLVFMPIREGSPRAALITFVVAGWCSARPDPRIWFWLDPSGLGLVKGSLAAQLKAFNHSLDPNNGTDVQLWDQRASLLKSYRVGRLMEIRWTRLWPHPRLFCLFIQGIKVCI